jgi:hypothetical protein
MKTLAILLNFYMALLMLLPCQDSADSKSSSVVTIASAKESKDQDDCGQEQCPPFCSCACCSVGKSLPSAEIQSIAQILPSAFYNDALTTALLKQPFAIWQPPKLV